MDAIMDIQESISSFEVKGRLQAAPNFTDCHVQHNHFGGAVYAGKADQAVGGQGLVNCGRDDGGWYSGEQIINVP